mmetsp:Transcript_79284/g.220440  ORF Transcript_79284/g.220440 Transcript_79284/m.220440 type:complete len:228 (+) Transcript_79284:2089-2772(+)
MSGTGSMRSPSPRRKRQSRTSSLRTRRGRRELTRPSRRRSLRSWASRLKSRRMTHRPWSPDVLPRAESAMETSSLSSATPGRPRRASRANAAASPAPQGVCAPVASAGTEPRRRGSLPAAERRPERRPRVRRRQPQAHKRKPKRRLLGRPRCRRSKPSRLRSSPWRTIGGAAERRPSRHEQPPAPRSKRSCGSRPARQAPGRTTGTRSSHRNRHTRSRPDTPGHLGQ